ncbi:MULTISPECIES: hypothetical protein [unclassified Pseudomonas]|uniref:hypothetical protein n=1 Tax=unclassified Pseudomonas TaxID=196821 RepID=UPI0039B73BB2
MITTKLDMRGLVNLAKRMQTLAKTKTKVGFFEDSVYDDGMPVAQVAAYNEYGTRFHPERPFMQETLQDKLTIKKIISVLKLAATASIQGKGSARAIMATLGRIVAEEIKITIANYPGHNSARTIAAKGFDRPLYDTGKMLESVKFKVGV